jgi:hypothetical protein
MGRLCNYGPFSVSDFGLAGTLYVYKALLGAGERCACGGALSG